MLRWWWWAWAIEGAHLAHADLDPVARATAVHRWANFEGDVPPWWPVTAADDLEKHPTLLFEGTAKVVRRGKINECGEKCAALVDERSATMDVVVKTARFVNTSAIEKHASELVSELVWLEYLRGRPGIPVLWGAWATRGRRGLTYVVEDAGEPMKFFIPSEHFRPERYADERYKAFVRSKPLATAKAFVECFHSFSQVGGFFLDDFVPHQFVYADGSQLGRRGVRRIALVDGPKLLGRSGELAPLYQNSSHVIETAPRACVGDAACPHTKKSHCCCGSSSPNGRPDGSRGAPESKGRCADRACVPLSSATHVFDVAAHKWALPFIEQLAREDGHLVVADGLRALIANMTRRDAGARPSFSEVLDALHALRTLELRATGKNKE